MGLRSDGELYSSLFLLHFTSKLELLGFRFLLGIAWRKFFEGQYSEGSLASSPDTTFHPRFLRPGHGG